MYVQKIEMFIFTLTINMEKIEFFESFNNDDGMEKFWIKLFLIGML